MPPTWYVPPHRSGEQAAILDGDAELAAVWPGQLPTDQHTALAQLIDAMPYLGRAQNRCAGRIDDTWTPHHHRRWGPLDVADAIGTGRVASVLAPDVPLDTTTLLARPAPILHGNLAIPAGARLLAYQYQHEIAASATTIRLTVIGRRPPATETVAVTDLLRRAALAQLGALRGSQARTRLGGRDADASILRDQHAHTSYLPLIDRDEVTAIVAWTPAGLATDEVTALRSITRLSTNQQSLRVWLTPTPPATVSVHAPTLVGPTTTWLSATPYMPSRYPKKRDRLAFLQDDIARELRHRGLPAPASVDISCGGWRAWRRHRPSVERTSPQGRPTRDAAFLRLTFHDPVNGPLALGHLSHFGLGLFVPDG